MATGLAPFWLKKIFLSSYNFRKDKNNSIYIVSIYYLLLIEKEGGSLQFVKGGQDAVWIGPHEARLEPVLITVVWGWPILVYVKLV